MWTSDNSHTAFLGVTCHYIDDNWTLRHFLLDIIPFHESHSGKNMAQTLTNLLSELNQSSKTFAITTDNAASMLVCEREMANELKNKFNNINFSHFRCGAHILNLAVQYGLQVHDASVDKVRKFFAIPINFWKIYSAYLSSNLLNSYYHNLTLIHAGILHS